MVELNWLSGPKLLTDAHFHLHSKSMSALIPQVWQNTREMLIKDAATVYVHLPAPLLADMAYHISALTLLRWNKEQFRMGETGCAIAVEVFVRGVFGGKLCCCPMCAGACAGGIESASNDFFNGTGYANINVGVESPDCATSSATAPATA